MSNESINIKSNKEPQMKHDPNFEPNKNSVLFWTKSDTDLLELVTALYESRSIQNPEKNLTRKEAIALFSKFLNHPIKDVESKLSSATDRKKDISKFLTSLAKEFEEYAKKKDKKLDQIRK